MCIGTMQLLSQCKDLKKIKKALLTRWFVLSVVFFGVSIPVTGQVSELRLVKSDSFAEPVSTVTELLHFAPTELSEKNRAVLNKIISVNIKNMPLDESLQKIAALGNIRIGYSKDIANVDWQMPVTIQYERATILGALYAALGDSGLKLILTSPSDRGHLLVVNGSVSDYIDAEEEVKKAANPGMIYGEVREASTGEPLPGANVVVKGTTIGNATDIDGRFVLRRVPAGEQVLVVRFLGFVTKEIPIMVASDERVEVQIALVDDFIEGDEIYVTARQRGQARALTMQRESVNIRSVVSSEQMDRFADVSVEGSLQRIAGMGHGGANIRGVGAGASNITMDGQRMGSTGGADRTVDLSTLSADMVQQLEVIKVITPDMDADALSGVININTRRPIGGERNMNVRAGGGYNSRFISHTGPTARLAMSYGDSPSNRFAYGVNFSYQRNAPANESVRTDWAIRNFEHIEGASEVLDGLRAAMNFDPQDRYGAGIQFTVQPSERTTYHVQLNLNYQDSRREGHTLVWDPNVSKYVNPNRTEDVGVDASGRAGDLRYNTELRNRQTYQYTARMGARHLFDNFDMEYKLGWGHGRRSENQYNVNFNRGDRLSYLVFFDNGQHHPEVEIDPNSRRPGFPRLDELYSNDMDHRRSFNKDNEFTATIDFDIPMGQGSLKLGSSALMTFKDGFSERYNMNFEQQIMSLKNFERHIGGEFRVFDRPHDSYLIPFLVDLHAVKDWYYTLRPHFRMDMESWAFEAETSFYDAHEHTYASYGMGRYRFGPVTLLGGLRVEHTDVKYKGREGTISHEGWFLGAVDATANNSYTNLFPNLQMVYHLGRLTNVRLAYSRSIGRPTLNQLSAYMLRDYFNERLSHGNPELEPMLSNNLDLLFEHYFMNVGQFTVGLYYKQMRDFVYSFSERIHSIDGIDGSGLYAGWRRSTFLNGEEAKVYGMEVSWQQNLDFLPGILGNFGTYANYSYAYSEADLQRAKKARLQDQRPHVLNAGLDFTKGNFSSQVSYRWGAPSISSYGSFRQVPAIPHVPENYLVYFDQYRDAANDLSLTLRYRLTQNFRLWMDANNILNYRSISYYYDRTYYPHVQSLNGRRVSLGVRYTF